jgi:hypothetical protein
VEGYDDVEQLVRKPLTESRPDLLVSFRSFGWGDRQRFAAHKVPAETQVIKPYSESYPFNYDHLRQVFQRQRPDLPYHKLNDAIMSELMRLTYEDVLNQASERFEVEKLDKHIKRAKKKGFLVVRTGSKTR